MSHLKKKKKLWIYVLIGVLVLLVGGYFILSRSSALTGSWNKLSSCSFNPYISEKNKKLIEETITTVAHKGVFSLLGQRSHLEDMGKVLSKEVSDLAYWAYILKHPKLKSYMTTIQKSSPKYNGFVEGTQDRLIKEYKQNPCLLEQAKGFAKYVGLSEETTVALLKKCFEKEGKDEEPFENFLDYILSGKEPEKK